MSVSERQHQQTNIRATVSGPITGQVAVGTGITQTQRVSAPGTSLADDDVRALKQLIDDLRAGVETRAPLETKAAAHERVAELEQAITAKVPDLSTMESVKNWFARHLPTLAGAVASVVISPLVGRIVSAAGDTIAAEFQRKLDSWRLGP